MKHLIAITLILILTVLPTVGCKEKEPDEPPPPPPKTASVLAKGMRDSYKTQLKDVSGGKKLTPAIAAEACGGLSKKKGSVAGEENGPKALSIIESELSSAAQAGFSRENWGQCLLGGALYKTLVPEDTSLDRIMRRSKMEIQRPVIKKLSFISFGDETTVFVTGVLYDGKEFDQKYTVGDEYLGLRLDGIVGRQKGIRVEYTPTGKIYDVMSKDL